MSTSYPAADQLTSEALNQQLKIGKMMFAVALAPLIMQVRERCVRGTARATYQGTSRTCAAGNVVHAQKESCKWCCPTGTRVLSVQVALMVYFFYFPPGSGATADNAQLETVVQSFSFAGLSSLFGTARSQEIKTTHNFTADDSCVIGFSDLHGDLQQAHAVLRASGASNDTHLWAAGACSLVQTGDLVDRGPNSVAVTKLFEDLKAQATAAGGKVVTLLGNHELMNLQVCLSSHHRTVYMCPYAM